jgi:hypothetical protein
VGIDAERRAASKTEIDRAHERMQSLADEVGGDFLGGGGFRTLLSGNP